jgi:hypothetical protein
MDHREIIADLTEEEFTLWKHNPITAAFLAFLKDQAENWRDQIALIVEYGHFDNTSNDETKNLHIVRGKILAIDGADSGLLGLTVEAMQAFYADERQDRTPDGTEAD